ncbi:MAG TPA: aspartate--tRNA ligase [Clostridia bacterium]|nr:aspartate--tRNA ligase [Clostridia bacterium]
MAQLDFLGDLDRTHRCGELRASDVGANVVLMGWVNRRRDLGNLIFIDLRDRAGMTQVVFDREASPELHDKANELRNEYVVAVVGRVKQREAVNKNIPTGEIEVVASELRLLNESKVPPFLPTEKVNASEELKLKYRYLDLRRAEMQGNIELRHKVALAIREELNSRGFLEIETPFMTRSTPEGARDYLVPSRVHPGEFYALPQSPQIFKQILMISGFDRYFQIVRCFRDEDLRADRQPEFTQIDLEMTFPTQEMVFDVVEGFLQASFRVAGYDVAAPFPQMTYDQAIRLYGIDKPDLRLPAMTEVKNAFTPENLQTLGFDADLPLVAIRTPKIGELSRKERDEIKTLVPDKAKDAFKLIDDFKRLEKSFPDAVAKIRHATEAQEGDLLILAGAPQRTEIGSDMKTRAQTSAVFTTAGQLRLALAQKYAQRHGCFQHGVFKFVWVTDFPMFEWDDTEQRWNAAHHPFTSPHENDMEKLGGGMDAVRDPLSQLSTVRALAYDVALNGTELGSGSIRIHRQDLQAKIFEALGMSPEEQQARFGFFLEALQYGTPPHGGIALGLDRIVMILAGAPSLREVIPFPKTAQAKDLMMDAPTPVSDAQLEELGISVKK